MKIDSEIFRDYLVLEACWAGKPVDIDGVKLDLAHPELDRAEWTPIGLIGEIAGTNWGPAIQLPWARAWELERLSQRENIVKVSAGDTVTIKSVEAVETAGELGKFDHPHHRFRRWARLAVIRSEGTRIDVPGIWIFAGVADVLTPIFLNDSERTRTALISRFEQISGVDDIADSVLEEEQEDFRRRFSEHRKEVKLLANLLWHAEHDSENISAMAFGYMIGRAEGRQVRQTQAKVAATNTRKTGDDTRRTAIEVIEETPQIILKRCAEEVAERLGRKEVRSVERTIKTLFERTSDGSIRPSRPAVEAAKKQLISRP